MNSQYKVFDAFGVYMSRQVSAKDNMDAMRQAKLITTAPMVQRVLTEAEQRQKQMDDNRAVWN